MSTFNERLARAFQQAGHTVSIYTFSLQYPSFLFPGTSQYSTEAAPQGLDIKVVINSVNPLNWVRVGNMIRQARPDIIVVRYWLPFMGPCFGTITRIAKKNNQSKVICIADNVIPHEKRTGDKAFTKYFIKPVDAFITMSKNVLDDLKKFNNNKPAEYIPHPLYDNFGAKISKGEARNQLEIPLDQPVILFCKGIRDVNQCPPRRIIFSFKAAENKSICPPVYFLLFPVCPLYIPYTFSNHPVLNHSRFFS